MGDEEINRLNALRTMLNSIAAELKAARESLSGVATSVESAEKSLLAIQDEMGKLLHRLRVKV